MKTKWSTLVIIAAFLTCSCGLIDEKDTLPQQPIEGMNADRGVDPPSRGR
jgi:hypothetical protein